MEPLGKKLKILVPKITSALHFSYPFFIDKALKFLPMMPDY